MGPVLVSAMVADTSIKNNAGARAWLVSHLDPLP